MASNWQETTIGALLEANGGEIKTGPFGTKLKASEYSAHGVPVISVGEIQLGRIVLHNKTPKVSPDVTDRMSEYLLKEGDIVFGRKGAVERSARVDYKQTGWFLGSDGIRLRLPKICNNQFIAYQFLTEAHKQWMVRHAAGTTMASLNEGIIRRIPIVLGPRSDQNAIAHILGSLDNKIELNRRMNATLEAMAQALFKSWFVDFDPVIDNALAAGNPIPEPLRARAEARKALGDQRKPLPEAIQKKFPDRFVFNEKMGWVPEGWGVFPAEEVASKIGMGPFGSNIKVSTFVEFGVPIISGQHLNKTLLTDEKYNFITEEHAERLKNSKVTRGDIIFTHAGNIGQVSLIPEKTEYSKYVISQRQFYLRPDPEKIFSSYLVFFFRSHVGQYKLLANASQVGVPSIARPSSHLKSIELLVPNFSLAMKFDRECLVIFNAMISNEKEMAILEKIRDTLLPKLLSGQLRIPDAEKLAANAT